MYLISCFAIIGLCCICLIWFSHWERSLCSVYLKNILLIQTLSAYIQQPQWIFTLQSKLFAQQNGIFIWTNTLYVIVIIYDAHTQKTVYSVRIEHFVIHCQFNTWHFNTFKSVKFVINAIYVAVWMCVFNWITFKL